MSAWANIEKPNPINFTDILSEEISRNLKAKKAKSILDLTEDGWAWVESDECDEELIPTEKNTNEESELCDSNYQKASLKNDSETNLEEGINGRNKGDFDIFDHLENEFTRNTDVLQGQKLQNSDEVINRYDIVLTNKKSGSKISSLPPKFRNDEGKMVDFNSSYNFFKSLDMNFCKEEFDNRYLNKYRNGVLGLDRHSHNLLYKMIAHRVLQSVNHVMNASSEAIILYGTLDPSYEHATKDWPKHCAIKVFKKVSQFQYTLSYEYKEELADEVKTIQWWTQNEMDNLLRVQKAGVLCPQVIKLKGHILVMSFIGKDKTPAPKLKYVELGNQDYVNVYEQVKNAMRLLYKNGNLIHGDMSEHNILWHDGQCYFIDFSHSVNPGHEYGYYFLHSDCLNITKYFGKYIPEIEEDAAEELFKSITGFNYGDKEMLYKMQNIYKENPYIHHKPPMGSS